MKIKNKKLIVAGFAAILLLGSLPFLKTKFQKSYFYVPSISKPVSQLRIARPDLLIEAVSYTYALSGGLTIQTTVKNNGTAVSAAQASILKFIKFGGAAVASTSVPALPSGESATVTTVVSSQAVQGLISITANVDANNNVVESDESNNTRSILLGQQWWSCGFSPGPGVGMSWKCVWN